ncbi:MAG TPA: energy transducer TonB [Pyrinomonadaceae bacterium]|nr:energy transducer TonB [Pyrinomonadaceae bacterium]
MNEKAKFLPLPAFPKACRCSGNAFVQIIIDEMGNVIRATAISGHPLLRIEAERAARRAKFSPFYHGAGILVKAIIVYKFKPDGIVDTSIDKNGNSQSSVKKITISCGQCNSKAIFLAKPEYPEAAKAVRASGSVLVDILVNEKGNVESVKVKSGHPLLWSVSEKAALKSKFEPKLIGGNSVRFYSTIVYNFVSQ